MLEVNGQMTLDSVIIQIEKKHRAQHCVDFRTMRQDNVEDFNSQAK